MKKRIGILVCCMIALIWAMARPLHTSATPLDDFGTCVTNYSNGWGQCWDTAASVSCEPGSAGDPCRTQVLENKVACLANGTNIFSTCTYAVNFDYSSPDFCTGASGAAYECALAFQGVDNFDAWSACRAASGIDRCQ